MNIKFILCIVCFSILLIAASTLTISNEAKRTQLIPLSFSEIHQMQREQTNIGPISLYYAMLNDAVMNLFEAYNLSYKVNSEKSLAHELEVVTEDTFKVHKYNLTILLTNLPFVVNNALNSLNDIIEIEKQIITLNNFLSSSWTASHIDEFHTEIYTTTDSKGNSTTHTRQVYDDTIHTYTFNTEQANQSLITYQSIILRYSNIIFPEVIIAAKKIGAEGEYAVETSWKNVSKKKLNNDDIKKIILNWPDKTYYNINKPIITNDYNDILSNYNSYQNSLSTSHNARYKTYSHSDSGPIEYQISEYTRNKTTDIICKIDQIINPMIKVKETTINYLKDIRLYESSILDGNSNKINISKLRNSILNTSKDYYKSNFPKGNIIDYFNCGVFLLVLLYIVIYFCFIYASYKIFYKEF